MGRKRKYAVGVSATEKTNRSVADLKKSGGARKTWRLSSEANAALLALMARSDAPKNETALVCRVLIEENERMVEQDKTKNS